MFCRRRTTTAPLAVWTACACLSLSVGCTGSRFQLANRNDTPYAKDLAANDVRVPVNNGSNDSLLADGPRVPYDRNDRERFAANIPAEPTYPDGPLGAPSSVPPPLPLASQAGGPLPANRSLPMSNPYGPMVGMAAGVDGSEIAGRVVTDRGQPAPRIAVQATDPAQPGRILAEGATDENGLFRFRQLPAGRRFLYPPWAKRSMADRLVPSRRAYPIRRLFSSFSPRISFPDEHHWGIDSEVRLRSIFPARRPPHLFLSPAERSVTATSRSARFNRSPVGWRRLPLPLLQRGSRWGEFYPRRRDHRIARPIHRPSARRPTLIGMRRRSGRAHCRRRLRRTILRARVSLLLLCRSICPPMGT